MQDFRKLRVWQRAQAFAFRVEDHVLKMPHRDPAGRKGQLARAADSIPTNIAEGCGAASQRDFARYLDNAIKSTTETERHLITVGKRGWLTRAECDALVEEVVEIRRMIYALRKKVLADLDE
jgi:four helix bundle protein